MGRRRGEEDSGGNPGTSLMHEVQVSNCALHKNLDGAIPTHTHFDQRANAYTSQRLKANMMILTTMKTNHLLYYGIGNK